MHLLFCANVPDFFQWKLQTQFWKQHTYVNLFKSTVIQTAVPLFWNKQISFSFFKAVEITAKQLTNFDLIVARQPAFTGFFGWVTWLAWDGLNLQVSSVCSSGLAFHQEQRTWKCIVVNACIIMPAWFYCMYHNSDRILIKQHQQDTRKIKNTVFFLSWVTPTMNLNTAVVEHGQCIIINGSACVIYGHC